MPVIWILATGNSSLSRNKMQQCPAVITVSRNLIMKNVPAISHEQILHLVPLQYSFWAGVVKGPYAAILCYAEMRNRKDRSLVQ